MANKGSATASQKKLSLVVSEEKKPAVKLQPGMHHLLASGFWR